MPPRRFRIQAAALGEIDEAFEWYRRKSHETAERFLAEVEHGLDAVTDSPFIWPTIIGCKAANARRYVMRTFPYDIVYFVSDEEVEVIAVAHHKRDQGYWSGR